LPKSDGFILLRIRPSARWRLRLNIRKHLKTVEERVYTSRKDQPHPKLGDYLNQLDDWLTKDAGLPRKQRRTAQRLFECLQIEGYRGGYTAVQRHVKDWKRTQTSSPTIKQAFVPSLSTR